MTMVDNRSIRTVLLLSHSNKEYRKYQVREIEYLQDRTLLEEAEGDWEILRINFTITALSSKLRIIISRFRILKWTFQMGTCQLTTLVIDLVHLFPTFRKRTRWYYLVYNRATMGTAQTEQMETLIWIDYCHLGVRTSSLLSLKEAWGQMRGKKI